MANNTKKITKAMKYEAIIAALTGEPIPHDLTAGELAEFAQGEIDLLAKKNASKSAASAEKATEDEKYMALIVEYLGRLPENDDGKTVTEIGRIIPELNDFVPSKITYLVTQLKNAGRVVNHKVKGKSLYKLA